MYCIQCGVKLADTETKCPLCNTVVYHPDIEREDARPLYPHGKMPKSGSGSKALNGAVIFLFTIPLIVCLLADLLPDGGIDWVGYVIGALAVAYVAVALPLWFKKPNPVVFVPCNFAAAALYLLYIDLVTGGGWFWSFALPIAAVGCLITSAAVTLLYYLRRGRLYVFGGVTMAVGAFAVLIEFLMTVTFGMPFIGWSVYPLAVLLLCGFLLIYFAINKAAREIIERKLFF